MAFKREAKINGAWVDVEDLEIRNVDRCDGCGLILAEDESDSIHFRVAASNHTRTLEMQFQLGRHTHKTKSCVLKAINDQVMPWVDGLEDE